jgi:hypothetical protein
MNTTRPVCKEMNYKKQVLKRTTLLHVFPKQLVFE